MRSKTTGSGGGSQCGTPVRKRDGFVEGRVEGWGWGRLSCAQRWRCTRGTNAAGRLQKNGARGKQVPEVTGWKVKSGQLSGMRRLGKRRLARWRSTVPRGTMGPLPPRFPAAGREFEFDFVRKPTSSGFPLSASCFQRSVFHVEHWPPSPLWCGLAARSTRGFGACAWIAVWRLRSCRL